MEEVTLLFRYRLWNEEIKDSSYNKDYDWEGYCSVVPMEKSS